MTLVSPIIFSIDKFKQSRHDVNGSPVIITVKKEKLKRVAVISSVFLVQNLTSLPLEMSIMSSRGVYSKINIPNNEERYPIDFDRIKDSFTVSLNEAVSKVINLPEIASKNLSIKVPLECSNESYNNMIMEVYTKRMLTFIDLKPALKVLNLCPVPINFSLVCKDKEISMTVFRAKPIELYKFDPYREQCHMTITVNESYSAVIDITRFLAKEEKRSVTLMDNKGSKYKIHIDLENNKFRNELTIYSKFNIINETGAHLEIHSFNPSISGASQKLVGNGTDTVLFQSTKSHTTFVVKTNPRTFEEVVEFPVELKPSVRGTCFFPKNISYNLNETITGGSENTFYEYNLAIIPNTIKLGPKIFTKTITIAPQYVIMNDTTFCLEIHQPNVREINKVLPGLRQPLIWRTPSKKASIQLLKGGTY